MDFATSAEHVRTIFFPRWDKGRQWKIVQANDLDGAQGHCERATKTISILDGMKGNDLHALLIHEIAHAVSNDCHGKRWLKRMEDAANHAQQQELPMVAALLRQQIEGYTDGFHMTAATMYAMIEDCVVTEHEITFLQVVDFLRRECGMNRIQFLRRFRQAERVFVKVKRDVRESTEAKAKMNWLTHTGG